MFYCGAHASNEHVLVKVRKDTNTLYEKIKTMHQLGASAVQVFLKSNRSMNARTKLTIEQAMEVNKYTDQYDIRLAIHASYMINFCHPVNTSKAKASRGLLLDDLYWAEKCSSNPIVVIHVGKALKYDHDKAIENFHSNINQVLKDTTTKNSKILIESASGQGTELFVSPEDFCNMYKRYINNSRIGICLDTCHLASGGVHINTLSGVKEYIEYLETKIGKGQICLTHFNDSKTPVNSRKDRHQTITTGTLFSNNAGIKAGGWLLKYCKRNSIPVILETPDITKYPEEITLLKNWVAGGSITLKNTDLKQDDICCDKTGRIKSNEVLVEIMENIGNYMTILNKPFKARAYKNAASIIQNFQVKITSSQQLDNYSGIGDSIKTLVDEIIKTGKSKKLMELKKDPCVKSIHSISSVWGIGATKAKEIVTKYGIKNITELRKSLKKNTLTLTKTQELGVKYYTDIKKRIPFNEIAEYEKILLKSKPSHDFDIVLAGSYRRNCGLTLQEREKTSSGDIDVIMFHNSINKKEDISTSTSNFIKEYIDSISSNPDIEMVEFSSGKSKYMGLIKLLALVGNNKKVFFRRIDIRLFPIESKIPAILHFTGSSKNNQFLRKKAKKLNMKLSEYGLYDLSKTPSKSIQIKSEKDIFDILKVKYLKPCER